MMISVKMNKGNRQLSYFLKHVLGLLLLASLPWLTVSSVVAVVPAIAAFLLLQAFFLLQGSLLLLASCCSTL
jgi:hypothetical protein